MYRCALLLAVICLQAAIYARYTDDVITITVEDPLIQIRAEEAAKAEQIREDFKLKNIGKTFKRDFFNIGKDLKKAWNSDMQGLQRKFVGEYEPGRLTGEPFGPKKHMKTGKKLEKDGEYFVAACSYLDALDLRQKKAWYKKLKRVAKKAYQSKLAKAQTAMNDGDTEGAYIHYEQLKLLRDVLLEHKALDFKVIDLETTLDDVRYANADRFYKEGEQHRASEQWEAAATAYRKVRQYLDYYLDCEEQLASCLYTLGRKHLALEEYEQAADYFLEATRVWDGFEEDRVLGGALNYKLGQYYFDQKCYKTALDRWQKLYEANPAYRDIFDRVQEARRLATTVISLEKPQAMDTVDQDKALALHTALNEAFEERATEFLVIDNFNESPDLVISGQLNQMAVVDQEESASRLLKEDIREPAKGEAYWVQTISVKYSLHNLLRTMKMGARLQLDYKDSAAPQAYQWDITWDREHEWTVVDGEPHKGKKRLVTGGWLNIANDIVSDVRGTKVTVNEVMSMRKYAPASSDEAMREMTTKVIEEFSDQVFARLNEPEQVIPPTNLTLTFPDQASRETGEPR